MIVARSELEGAVRKAALGLKWSGGLADEANAAVAWLGRQGLLNLAAMNNALEASGDGALDESDGGLKLNYQSIVRVGPSVFDLVKAGSAPVSVEVDTGLELLAGYAAIAANGDAFRLSWDGGEAVIAAHGAALDGPLPTEGAVTVSQADADEVAESGVDQIEVTTEDWAKLQKLASTYYVIATEENRLSGAGAGLNDND
ncbi:MAG: DUF3726 domain-containing protein [Pikeienuella sp.]